MKKHIVIEGNNIKGIVSFYEEINRVFMQNEEWKIGNSLDALNDLLHGGVGEIKANEPVQLIWNDIMKSKEVLGLGTTKAFYNEKLTNPSTYNVKWVMEKLEALEKNEGETYFEIVMNIIAGHSNIELLEK